MDLENIQVAARFKLQENDKFIWKVGNTYTLLNEKYVKDFQKSNAKSLQFIYDKCFDQHQNTNRIYNSYVRRIIISSLSGYNGTIFAYGQQCTGKNYTMIGDISQIQDQNQENFNHGIIFHSIDELCKEIQNTTHKTFRVQYSYVEIYHEKVYDLLDNNPNKTNLSILEIKETGDFQMKGLIEKEVTNLKEIQENVIEAQKHKSNQLEQESGIKSHMLFRLHIICYQNQRIKKFREQNKTAQNFNIENLQELTQTDPDDYTFIVESQLNFCVIQTYEKYDIDNLQKLLKFQRDLQTQSSFKKSEDTIEENQQEEVIQPKKSETSESTKAPVKKKSIIATKRESGVGKQALAGKQKPADQENDFQRQQSLKKSAEDQTILTKSVFFLKEVILKRAANNQNDHIPCRNSIITKILKQALCGNSKTFMLLCVNGSYFDFDHSLKTFNFGIQARKIENQINCNIISSMREEDMKYINEYLRQNQLMDNACMDQSDLLDKYRRENIKLKEQLQNYQDQDSLLQQLQKELSEIKENQQIEIDKLNQEYQVQLQQQKESYDKLMQQLMEIQEQHDKCPIIIKERDDTIIELQNQLKDLKEQMQNEITKYNNELKIKNELIDGLQNENKQMKLDNQLQQEQIDKYKLQQQQNQEEIDNLQQQLDQNGQMNQKNRNTNQDLYNKIKQLEDKIQEQQLIIAQNEEMIQKLNDQLSQKDRDINQYQNTQNQNNQQIQNLNQQIQNLNNEIQQQQHNNDISMKQKDDIINGLKQQLYNQKQEIQDMQNENQMIQQQQENIINDLQKQIQEYKLKLNVQLNQYDELKQSLKNQQQMNSQKQQEIQNQQRQYINEINKLKDQIQNLNIQIQNLNNDIKDIQLKNHSLKLQLDEYMAQIKEKDDIISDQQQQKFKIQTDLDSLNKKLQEQKNIQQQNIIQFQNLQEVIENLNSRIKLLDQQKQQDDDMIEQLTAQLIIHQQVIDKMKDDIDVQNNIISINQDYGQQDQLQIIKRQNSQLKTIQEQYIKHSNSTKNQVVDLQNQLDQLKEVLKEANMKLQELQIENQDFTNTKEQYLNMINQMKQENKNLLQFNYDFQNQRLELKNQLQSQQNQFNNQINNIKQDYNNIIKELKNNITLLQERLTKINLQNFKLNINLDQNQIQYLSHHSQAGILISKINNIDKQKQDLVYDCQGKIVFQCYKQLIEEIKLLLFLIENQYKKNKRKEINYNHNIKNNLENIKKPSSNSLIISLKIIVLYFLIEKQQNELKLYKYLQFDDINELSKQELKLHFENGINQIYNKTKLYKQPELDQDYILYLNEINSFKFYTLKFKDDITIHNIIKNLNIRIQEIQNINI